MNTVYKTTYNQKLNKKQQQVNLLYEIYYYEIYTKTAAFYFLKITLVKFYKYLHVDVEVLEYITNYLYLK